MGGISAISGAVSNEAECAKTIGKSESTIRRWAAKFEWKERTRRYDNAVLEESRQELRRRLSASFLKRWQDLDELAMLAADELRAKISNASPRVLNEVLATALEGQLKILDKLDVLNADVGTDRELTINIVSAEPRQRAIPEICDAL